MLRYILIVFLLIASLSTVKAEDSDDISAIRQTALNYMEAWYQGDAKKMKACLHKKLAKRSLRDGWGSKKELRLTTASKMINYTSNGGGQGSLLKDEIIDVTVLDYHKSIASVKVLTPHYYEYLHLIKMDGNWVIINALYANRSQND